MNGGSQKGSAPQRYFVAWLGVIDADVPISAISARQTVQPPDNTLWRVPALVAQSLESSASLLKLWSRDLSACEEFGECEFASLEEARQVSHRMIDAARAAASALDWEYLFFEVRSTARTTDSSEHAARPEKEERIAAALIQRVRAAQEDITMYDEWTC